MLPVLVDGTFCRAGGETRKEEQTFTFCYLFSFFLATVEDIKGTLFDMHSQGKYPRHLALPQS